MSVSGLRGSLFAIALGAVAGCTSGPASTVEGDTPKASREVVDRLNPYCGKAFPGKVLEDRPASPDAIWTAPAVLHLRCQGSGKLLALHLGEDRSRVWLLGPDRSGFRLTHMHHSPEGAPDEVSGYGGIATEPAVSPTRVEFPVDSATRQIFKDNGLDESLANVWALEFPDADTFVYELRRPGRVFRIAFDLSRTVDTPPLPWAEAALR
jgi:hypothetical protein